MMKRLPYLAILAGILAVGFDYAGMINQFSAKPDGDGISLSWQSDIETGIRSYSIERCNVQTPNSFQEAGNIAAKGSYQSYSFHDSHPTAIAAQGQTPKPMADAFEYRLRINLSDGEVSYSSTVSVTKPSSGVRRTWGMIKEMFH